MFRSEDFFVEIYFNYFRTSPQVAYDRLRERGRKEESGVPMQFIQVQ